MFDYQQTLMPVG